MKLFYLFYAFVQIKSKKKKKLDQHFVCYFQFLSSPWNISLGQCDRSHILRSNALESIPAQSRTCAHLTRLCVRAHATVSNKQCSDTFERTSLAFERTCRVCYTFAWLRSIIVPALERTSAAAAVDPRQCMCSVFVLFNYQFIIIYLLCLFLFV